MLNIGGQLYGEAGAAENESGLSWSSVEIVSVTGSAIEGGDVDGLPEGSTGDATAVIGYTVEGEGEESYELTRTISYAYPNNYVTDTYSLYVPSDQDSPESERNIKFYYGGDTAPGSSDEGYGIMYTDPVRDVLSLNPQSRIIYGLREVASNAPNYKEFDGAISQSYDERYEDIAAGVDLGYFVEKAYHDAGINIQWNFGNTPGQTYTAAMQQYVSPAGRMLKASFDRNNILAGSETNLKLRIDSADVDTISGVSYQIALPSGLTIGSGDVSNFCGGTVSASAGGSTITLSGATINADTSCILYVPVTASTVGTYTVDADSVSNEQNVINVISNTELNVNAPIDPVTDLNGDGIDDEGQDNVQSVTSPLTGTHAVIEVDESCNLDDWSLLTESENVEQDGSYDYPLGLYQFETGCEEDDGYTTTVRQYYYGDVDASSLIGRKYDSNTNTYYDIDQSNVSTIDIYGSSVVLLTYEVQDGGDMDMDGEANGVIIDPAGLGSNPSSIGNGTGSVGVGVGAPNTGLNVYWLLRVNS